MKTFEYQPQPLVEKEDAVSKSVVEAENDESSEDRFYDLLESLGKELSPEWEKKLEPLIDSGELTFRDACNRLEMVLQERSRALSNMRTRKLAEWDEETEKRVKQFVEDMLRSKRLENFLGNGGVAEVYKIDTAPGFCVKFIVNQERYREGNTVYQEAELMERVRDVNVAGVRAPRFVKSFSGGDVVAIVMEELDAVNLQRAVEGLDTIPENFEADDYFVRLKKYLESIHQVGVFHQDLYLRNLMVDRNTGHPRVIDFGKGEYHPLAVESEDAEKKDWAQFEAARYKLKKYREQAS